MFLMRRRKLKKFTHANGLSIMHGQWRRQESKFSDVEGGQSKGVSKKILQSQNFTKELTMLRGAMATAGQPLPPPLCTAASLVHKLIFLLQEI
jgi:hypothetical protein